MRRVEELLSQGPIPLWRHPEWQSRFPWLQQGTTGRSEGPGQGDFGLFGELPAGAVMERWRLLRDSTGMVAAIHSRQLHRAEVAEWRDPLPHSTVVIDGFDAHVTRLPGILLTVSVADCVPIFLVDAKSRSAGLIHAGWRGTAAGILERGIEVLERAGAERREIWLHCGPSICGCCYEVGPEVHAGVHPERVPPVSPEPIDLRNALCERAERVGLDAERMTVSAHCTLCGPGDFFSHRAGSLGRQLGVLGYLP